MFKRRLIETLKAVINDLEDENQKLKEENRMLNHNNIILITNSEELRAKIKGLENILESYAEKEVLENKPKRRGTQKKEAK